MTQHTFVYRGVTYRKAVPQAHNPAKNAGKVYRGIGYEAAPKAPTRMADHVYRGASFAAAC